MSSEIHSSVSFSQNASPSRLLFNQDLKEYIAMINTYYYNVKQTPKLEEGELQQECQRIGDVSDIQL